MKFLCVCVVDPTALQLGDVLLQVQGISVQDMTRFEAWNLIKALPEGSMTVVVMRRPEGS